MRIQWDAALVAATARALDRETRDQRIRGYHLDPDRRRLAVFLRERTLVWELHPERAGLRLLPAMDPPPEATSLPARVRQVLAPADDRVVVMEWRRVRGRPATGSLVVELLPNQENVVATEGPDGTARAVLRTREGARTVRRGHPYTLPRPSDRMGIEEDPGPEWWNAILEGSEPGEARRELLRRVAWTSSLVVPHLVGPGGYGLWRRLRAAALGELPGEYAAAVVEGRFGPQPYPIPLPGITLTEHDTLLEAFREAEAQGDRDAVSGTLLPGFLVQGLDAEVERARTRVARLEEELAGLGDPEELQGWGDLILARFHQVPEGRTSVELESFDGGRVEVPLDPTLSPDANARRHYDGAARIRRALQGLPPRIRAAREERERLEDLRDRLARGVAGREEVEAVLPETPAGGGMEATSLPYRRFRSSHGLEIRVGRGAARNDDLTFHHSRPEEIWLHARHTAGAHVILRWSGPGSPPPRDLREAAVLAAVHSRARTSGTVPVDWTRRKYVRKPRGAAPGSVLPDRVQTVFVEPDEGLVERLRDD